MQNEVLTKIIGELSYMMTGWLISSGVDKIMDKIFDRKNKYTEKDIEETFELFDKALKEFTDENLKTYDELDEDDRNEMIHDLGEDGAKEFAERRKEIVEEMIKREQSLIDSLKLQIECAKSMYGDRLYVEKTIDLICAVYTLFYDGFKEMQAPAIINYHYDYAVRAREFGSEGWWQAEGFGLAAETFAKLKNLNKDALLAAKLSRLNQAEQYAKNRKKELKNKK